MSIPLACPCGAQLSAPEAAAGKLVACPKCKAHLKVPSAKPAPAENLAERAFKPNGIPPVRRCHDQERYDDQREVPSRSRRSRWDDEQPARACQQKGSALPWILAGGGTVLGLAGVIVALVVSTKKPVEQAATALPGNVQSGIAQPAPVAPTPQIVPGNAPNPVARQPQPASPQPAKPQPEPIRLGIHQLRAGGDNDDLELAREKFDAEYKGRLLEIYGEVRDIERHKGGLATISIKAPWARFGWRMVFTVSSERNSKARAGVSRRTNFRARSRPPGPCACQTSPKAPAPSRRTST
jgi:hypothetical protein